MNFKGGLFSESEIQKMASPERLDLLVEVTRMKLWIALVAVCLVVGTFLAWGLFGRLSITVKGEGILVNSGLKEVQAGGTGRLIRYRVMAGQRVERDEIVAEVALSGIADELELKRASLLDLQRTEKTMVQLDAAAKSEKKAALQTQIAKLPGEINASISVVSTKREQYEIERQAVASGVGLRAEANSAYASYIAAQQEVSRMRSELDQAKAELAQLESSTTEKAAEFSNRIADLNREVKQLEEQLKFGGMVRAPESGTIVELLSDEEHLVERQTRLLLIEPDNAEMEAVTYVPAEDAKKIRHDTNGVPLDVVPSRVSPSPFKAEEYGFIRGEVVKVSLFPATPEGMNKVLRNQSLVEKLTKEGTVVEVRVRMRRTPASPTEKGYTQSGYEWSSSDGPEARIASGTMCTGTYEVERKRPVEYIVPWVKKTVGIN